MSPPAVVIRLALESSPSVYLDCMNDSEETRLWEWVNSRDGLVELVASALDLIERERAA